jgi:hypothetical protein
MPGPAQQAAEIRHVILSDWKRQQRAHRDWCSGDVARAKRGQTGSRNLWRFRSMAIWRNSLKSNLEKASICLRGVRSRLGIFGRVGTSPAEPPVFRVCYSMTFGGRWSVICAGQACPIRDHEDHWSPYPRRCSSATVRGQRTFGGRRGTNHVTTKHGRTRCGRSSRYPKY